MENINEVIANAPDNFVIQNAIEKCFDVVDSHNKIMVAVSGGGDSDVMLDLLIKCGAKEKASFVFFNTGLEYQATLQHLDALEDKYEIQIQRIRPKKPIPVSVREYGQPFISKYASQMIHALQIHNFQWEDQPFEELIVKYPKCKSALNWWCNQQKGETTQFVIKRYPYLKEFMVKNPPQFMISNQCCTHSKKKVAHDAIRSGDYDLNCMGVRKEENGIRAAAIKTCFSDGEDIDTFRPVFWMRDVDKNLYCEHYGVAHSDCYTKYGLHRTGCAGCPFGKRFEEELEVLKKYEPKLFAAANAIFGKSYEYTRQYLDFRDRMKEARKNTTYSG